MSLITPSGTITFYNGVPFNPNYKHSLYFSSVSNQKTYFDTKKVFELNSQNYVKSENGKIRVQAFVKNGQGGILWQDVDSISYMSWKNTTDETLFENSITFYAFVTNVDMISINVVEISYKIDVIQTYLISGKADLGQCLVERMTPTHDNVGDHVEPEPVSFSNYVYQNGETQDKWSTNYENFRPVVFSSLHLKTIKTTGSQHMQEFVIWGKHAGALQGAVVNVFEDMDSFTEFFGSFQDEGENEDYLRIMNSIVAIIAVPPEFAVPANDFGEYPVDIIGNINISDNIEFTTHISGALGTETRIGNIDNGYPPKYKKLYTYPFNCISIRNANGAELELKYEYFNSSSAVATKFNLRYVVSMQPDFSILVFPMNYGGKYKDYEHGINVGQVPIVPHMTDAYKQWLGQSRLGTNLSAITSVIGGALSGNILAMASGFGGVAGLQDQSANAKMAKDSYSGGNTLPVVLDGGLTIQCYQKCVNAADARRIDEFFSRFGYAINKVIKPSIDIPTGRTHRYVKTNEAMVYGACPAEYCREIENAFNSGITFWDKDHIGVYEL